MAHHSPIGAAFGTGSNARFFFASRFPSPVFVSPSMASPCRISKRVPKPSGRGFAPSESPPSSLGKRNKAATKAKNTRSSDSPAKASSSRSKSSSSSHSKVSISPLSDSGDDLELSDTKISSDTSLRRSPSITLLDDSDHDGGGGFEEEEEDERKHDTEEDEDDGSEDEPQAKRVKKGKSAKQDPLQEITVNISLYSRKEMQKPVKKREPTACGLMQIPSNTLYYRFERKLLSKLAMLAKVAVITAEEDLQVEFQVPQHVPNHVLLDDEDAYKVMVAAAIKCKDPKINLAVVQLQENDGKVSDAEDDKKKKKKEKKKSKIPSENDISAPNAEINAKIGLLRTKYTCHANNGSDYCWVSSEDKRHIALGHTHFNLWAAAWAKGDADADTPPNHAIFSGKGNSGLAPPSILQKRIAANAANQAPSTPSTVVNFAFDGLAEILRPVIPATAAHQPPQIHETQMLLPPNTQPGQPMLISMFCIEYNLDDSILDKLTTNQYKNASAFRFIRLMDLEKMEFLPGDIAELQDAVQQWAVPL